MVVATFVIPQIIALLTALILTDLLIRLAPRIGLIDQPSDRKVHTNPTPRGGGLAIFAAVTVAAVWDIHWQAWAWPSTSLYSLSIFHCAIFIVLLGLLDDWYSLSWLLRLGAQTAVAVVAVRGCIPDAHWAEQAGSVVWVVAMTNAFNMLDNMDALSAGVAWIAAGWLTTAFLFGTPWDVEVLPLLILMSALAGFLWFNRPPACIFMGDSGSTFLGFFLGIAAVKLASFDPPRSRNAALAIFAVPCYDMASVIFLRLKQGRSPFQADKQHLSHRLVNRGLSKPAAVGVIYLLAITTGAAGVLLTWPTLAAIRLVR